MSACVSEIKQQKDLVTERQAAKSAKGRTHSTALRYLAGMHIRPPTSTDHGPVTTIRLIEANASADIHRTCNTRPTSNNQMRDKFEARCSE
jgi:hypothetical protein